MNTAINFDGLTPQDRERLDELEVELINEHLKGQEEADALARHEELYGVPNDRELLRDEHRCGGHTQPATDCSSCEIERYLNGGARSVALSMLAAEKCAEVEAEP